MNQATLISPTGAHGCQSTTDHDRDIPDIDLLSPLTIRGVTFRNRIAVGGVSL